ncbi:serine 3-dehydrogenase [Conidiobolus coronatus NRRL 28638]|uniref:Serine 3-dehydrogenase n=1 Tax=Conidiobolus coronatus (strain ATCC 28846 / CBS 209.66 / NRRL 28638) TaxID=796925 RepID=A0A137P7T6_CONC2|nr:serine 3-dehydrogenase [Conidiobolus coronatus NRRL 28638]|eukprot:KXN71055.1 serine 3-dehydrogenase [Conidiobolus coronatus NRRL 28638]
MNLLKNKIVLITGASSGIGEACAKSFAREGSDLILAARRVERLEALKKEINEQYPQSRVHYSVLNVKSADSVNDLINSLPEEFKIIDVLVNNAGLSQGLELVENTPIEYMERMIDTNVKGTVYCIQKILPKMRMNKSGHIINISSISGKDTYPGGGLYCASKFAVDAITRTLRQELVSSPIRVTCVNPGWVQTEFSLVRFQGDKDKADNVYKDIKPLSAEDIAETIVFVASRPSHVEISDITIFPNGQASTTMLHRGELK